MICEFGCGKEAKFSPGKRRRKWCCSESPNSCPEMKRKNIGGMKNRGRTKETHESVKRIAEKNSERMKKGQAAYMASCVTEEGRRRMSEKIKKLWKDPEFRNKHEGINHYFWNPNREQVFSPYTEEFILNKSKVRKRDKYTCQFPGCFKPGRTVHHIDENKQDSRLENMITLCSLHHNRIHTKDNGVGIAFYQPYFRELTYVL